MIISGVLKPNGQGIFNKIQEKTKLHIKKDLTIFENSIVSIIIGKTSSSIDQGEILTTDTSFLCGKVFSKKRKEKITNSEFEKIITLDNKKFVKEFWGSYLLFKKINDQLVILRDPVGQFPLFYSRLRDKTIIFSSHIEVLLSIKEENFNFNWPYISKNLLHTSFTSNQTAFESVFELPHGCQVVLNNEKKTEDISVVWNPLDYCDSYQNKVKLQNDIIEETSNVLRLWTKNSNTAFLDFSGGTDSTSLLFLLKDILPPTSFLQAINSYDPFIPSSDERRHAIKTAHELNIDLHLFDRSKSPLFDSPLNILKWKPNWPSTTLLHLKAKHDINKFSKDHKNVSHISGHGGDHIFMCQTPTVFLCDFLIQNNFDGFYAKLKDLSMMNRIPLYLIAKQMGKGFLDYFRQNYNISPPHKKVGWINQECLDLQKSVTPHPFFTERHKYKILPGKLRHIHSIFKGISTTKKDIRDCDTNPVFYPFFSQPLLELGLSIPTYESFEKGYNRYPFRKSVSEKFPNSNVWRKDKADTTGVTQQALKREHAKIYEYIESSILINKGLIDKENLLMSIRGIMRGQCNEQWYLLNMLSLESFLKIWSK